MALCYFIQFSNRYGYHQFTQPIQQIDMRLNINYFNFMEQPQSLTHQPSLAKLIQNRIINHNIRLQISLHHLLQTLQSTRSIPNFTQTINQRPIRSSIAALPQNFHFFHQPKGVIHVPFNAETVSNGVKCHQRGFQADFGHETQNGEP